MLELPDEMAEVLTPEQLEIARVHRALAIHAGARMGRMGHRPMHRRGRQ